jgi:ABC-type multidrug transport system fused ATPase/permease subunit
VLRDVSFTAAAGKVTALVGASGSGKITIMSLLMRLNEIRKGAILLEGEDIRTFRLGDLRKWIAMVMQVVFLFSGDIASNVGLARRLDDGQLTVVTGRTNALSFIRELPGGFREPVMERGSTLSAGQRQLLAFARTLAAEPHILVLDEATANIDTETEKLIQDSLAKLMASRTTLVIAHRLSTIEHADLIIVLHKGKVRESGRHAELLEKSGIYKDLYEMQFAERIR